MGRSDRFWFYNFKAYPCIQKYISFSFLTSPVWESVLVLFSSEPIQRETYSSPQSDLFSAILKVAIFYSTKLFNILNTLISLLFLDYDLTPNGMLHDDRRFLIS